MEGKQVQQWAWIVTYTLLAVAAAASFAWTDLAQGAQPAQPGEASIQAYFPQVLWGEIHRRQWLPLPSASSGAVIDDYMLGAAYNMALGPDGQPVIGWSDRLHTPGEIFVLRWNGRQWVEVGAGSASGGGISQTNGGSSCPSLAVAADGRIFVAWIYRTTLGYQRLFLRMWDGTAWVELGPNSASGHGLWESSEGLGCPSLAVSPDGRPHIAWTVSSQVYVLGWDGQTWGEVGEGSASGGGISQTGGSSWPKLAFAPDGSLYAAWEVDIDYVRGNIYVRRWNGADWQEVGEHSASDGGISNTTRGSSGPDLAVGLDGTPYVIWEDDGDISSVFGNFIYIRRWNGRIWEEIGPNSASQEGLSGSFLAHSPTIAISQDGVPYVAYVVSLEDGTRNIYVQRWDDKRWQAAGVEADTGQGISYGFGAWPQIEVNQHGLPHLLWHEYIREGMDSGYLPYLKVYR